jgi:hypothetical protein
MRAPSRLWRGTIAEDPETGEPKNLFGKSQWVPGPDPASQGQEDRAHPPAGTEQRSLKQNAYYWSVVVAMLADAAGYDDPEDMHDALRAKFLSIRGDGPLTRIP